MLALGLTPALYNFISQIDMKAAVWFNSAAGKSGVFDRFILLFADDDGQERILAVAALWFVTVLWLAPSRLQKSRLLGTLLFICAVLVPYFLVDSFLDDVIERRSPSYEFLKPFKDIGKILDFDNVDLTDKRSFPNPIGMILLTMGFMLLRLKHTRGGLIALVLGLTVPLLHCVAGLSWMTDIYMGSLPLALLVSAMAVETPFRRLHGSLMDLSAAGFDVTEKFGRNLLPMWRHRKQYWSSQNVLHMEVAVKRFASRELAGIIDKNGEFSDEPVKLEMPLSGLRSVVRIAAIGPRKAVLRAYPLSGRYDAEQHYRASNLLQKHGVRVPKILHKTESPKKYGAIFLVEEFIDGCSKEPAELTDDDIRTSAQEVSRLHQVSSEVWGFINSPRTEEYGTVLLRRVERQLAQIARGEAFKNQQKNMPEIRAWFNSWRNELNEVREFSLIHGKLHRENCLFETSGRFCLLDITTLEWGLAASDVVTVYFSQCGSQPELFEKFEAAYYSALPPELADRTRRFMPLFLALHCLSQITKYRKRQVRVKKRNPGDAVKKEMGWWNKLADIVAEYPR